MADFKFIHAADLHLGSPLHGLVVEQEAAARRFAGASRAAFADLVDRAIAERVAFFIVAGDVYDADWLDNSIGLFFARQLARLEQAGIEVFLLRGDHDAESPVLRNITLPPTIHQFSTATPSSFRIEALQVVLHGQGLAQRAVSENLASAYPGRQPGWFNIGVLHTSLAGRPPHSDQAPCTPGHLRARGYDYWALGHSHRYEAVGTRPHIVYPGNLQGRSIAETGEKGAVLVSVAGGEVSGIERVVVDRVRWEEVAVEAKGLSSEAAVLKAIEERLRPLAKLASERLVGLRVVLTGETEAHRHLLAHRDALTEEVQAAARRVHADIWLERVELRTQPPVATRRRAAPAQLAVDLAAIATEVAAGSALKTKAAALLADIKLRLPGTIPEAEQNLAAADLDQLLLEARELLLSRATEGT